MDQAACPPLVGVCMVEGFLLGLAAIATHLADFEAELIERESPVGDCVREMRWPIIRRRGAASLPRQPQNEEHFTGSPSGRRGRKLQGARTRRWYRDRGHAPGSAGSTWSWLLRTDPYQSRNLFLYDMGSEHERIRLASALSRHCLRHLGGVHQVQVRGQKILHNP